MKCLFQQSKCTVIKKPRGTNGTSEDHYISVAKTGLKVVKVERKGKKQRGILSSRSEATVRCRVIDDDIYYRVT